MGLIVAIFLLALLIGGFGIAFEALRWLLIIALALVIVGLVSGNRHRHY